jgi:UTP--glucose-1-phosphate uridylyltransferase
MLNNKSGINTALIPVAGKGTRLAPIASIIPKGMLPLVGPSNDIFSVLHVIVKQVLQAGVERIGVIVSPGQQDLFRKYFAAVQDHGGENFSEIIEYIIQSTPKGFGDAVLRGADFVGKESFVLLLGDHIQIPDSGSRGCTEQVIEAFAAQDCAAMIGVQTVNTEELSKVGVCRGIRETENIYRCTNFIEKPSLSFARDCLVTEGLQAETYLAHCGIYAFSSEIFTCLKQIKTKQEDKEIELADAQSLLLKMYPENYFLCKIRGRAYDVGTPAGYAETQGAFRNVSESYTVSSFRNADRCYVNPDME